jgi:hypothetical protein
MFRWEVQSTINAGRLMFVNHKKVGGVEYIKNMSL